MIRYMLLFYSKHREMKRRKKPRMRFGGNGVDHQPKGQNNQQRPDENDDDTSVLLLGFREKPIAEKPVDDYSQRGDEQPPKDEIATCA